MASSITFGGLASGLDTNSIVAALVAVEGRKVDALRTSRTGFQKKIDAFDSLLGKLRKLEDALKKLADPTRFVAHAPKLSAGAEDHLSVTARGDAHVGTYEVKVGTLAQSTFIRSDGMADPNADLGLAGTLTIDVGGTQTDIAVDGNNATLNGLRDSINDAGIGVVATTVFDGTDWHLELRGAETGAANAVTIVAEPGLPPPQGNLLNLTEIRAASDAAFTVDGQAFTSAGNTVDDAIQGVTLQLLGAQDPAEAPLQVTIAEDFAGIEQQLRDFVDGWNGVIDFLNAQSKPRAEGDTKTEPLAGDSLLRSLRSAMGITLSEPSETILTGYTSLASIGISTGSDGKLSLDSARLKDAIADDLDTIKEMVSDKTDGVGARLLAVVQARSKSITGSIAGRQAAFRTTIDSIDDRITRAEEQLEKFEESLRRRYAAMETLVGRLQAQGNSLAAITLQR